MREGLIALALVAAALVLGPRADVPAWLVTTFQVCAIVCALAVTARNVAELVERTRRAR